MMIFRLINVFRRGSNALARAQARLDTSEQRLSLMLEATGDGLWDYRLDERTYFSDTYYQMLGYSPDGDELQPDNWLKLVHRDDLAAVEEAMRRVRAGETDLLAVELRMRMSSGLWKWIFLRGRVIDRACDGPPLRMIGTVQDVDGRRHAERERRESQEIFRNAFQESPMGIALARLDGTLIKVNTSFCEMLGYTEAELLTMCFQQFTHPDDLQTNLDLLQTFRAGKQQHYAMEKRYIRKDGSTLWVFLNVGGILDDAGRPQYMIGQIKDITQRKQSEAELRAYARRLLDTKNELEGKTAEACSASALAEQALRAKSAFLANVSHEIRTPMAAIIGFADLLQDGRVPEAERARCVETIARQGQHLLALINDILDLSKAEAGKMAVEAIECDPMLLLAEVEAVTTARARDKGLAMDVRVAAGLPPCVRSDPTRLRQVMLNLVSNAIKFTPAGRITVELAPAELSGGREGLRFAVADTGIGIDAPQLDRLFEPFGQADASTTRRFGGTGLGLAISKRLVEMLGGTITVQSEVGRGSTFVVTVDAPPCAKSGPAAAVGPPQLRPGLRVLLAEDGPDNQRLIRFYLDHAGIDCDVAENGRIAVERAVAASAAGRPFDLVLMDMRMPEVDGCAAAVALRDAGLAVPVLALTAHATEEARARSLRAGCREHLVKPVDYGELLSAIARHTAASP